MAYTNLTNVADYDTLLGSLRTFLNTAGWTLRHDLTTPIAGSPGEGSTGRKLTVQKGDCLAGLRSVTTTNANRLFLFDGIPESASPLPSLASVQADHLNSNSGIRVTNAQYNQLNEFTSARYLQIQAGPFPNVYFFTDSPSTYCHVVVEVTDGVYSHMMFGNLQKYGTWTGGGYYACSRWGTDVVSIDSPTSTTHVVPFGTTATGSVGSEWTLHYESPGSPNTKWVSGNITAYTHGSVKRAGGRANARGGFPEPFRNLGQTPFSGVIALSPATLLVTNLTTPTSYTILGRVPDLRLVNITELVPAEEYILGADTWKVFPYRAKNGGTDLPNSGVYGFAYKKIP